MISLYGRDFVVLMELYICCDRTESIHCGSGFQTVYFSKLYSYCNCIQCSVGSVRVLYHCTYSLLRNTLWAWTYHRKMCWLVCYGLQGISGTLFYVPKLQNNQNNISN